MSFRCAVIALIIPNIKLKKGGQVGTEPPCLGCPKLHLACAEGVFLFLSHIGKNGIKVKIFACVIQRVGDEIRGMHAMLRSYSSVLSKCP